MEFRGPAALPTGSKDRREAPGIQLQNTGGKTAGVTGVFRPTFKPELENQLCPATHLPGEFW